jgi:hypothetical protein
LANQKTRLSYHGLDLPLPPVTALTDHRSAQEPERQRGRKLWLDHDVVFTTTVGTAIDPSNLLSPSGENVPSLVGSTTWSVGHRTLGECCAVATSGPRLGGYRLGVQWPARCANTTRVCVGRLATCPLARSRGLDAGRGDRFARRVGLFLRQPLTPQPPSWRPAKHSSFGVSTPARIRNSSWLRNGRGSISRPEQGQT